VSEPVDGTPPLPKNLRVLLVEDNPDDAELALIELRRSGYAPEDLRVQTAAELTAALTSGTWDVIVSDYSLPNFTAPEAFGVVRKLNLDIPFIIVSGTVGEETAVRAMRAGVHDFLLKGHLKRLVAAIEREIREAAMRAERRRIQEQLMISERMASMGTLAAGVAHEINNPLSVVVGNLHVIRQDLEKVLGVSGGPGLATAGRAEWPEGFRETAMALEESVRDAEEAAERVRDIVRDLKVFSRPENEAQGPVDVHKVIETSLRMARNEIRPRAKIVRSFDAVPSVEGNEGRLGQVFLNLLVNAAHAIPEGQAERNAITIRTRAEDGMVIVEVADTGIGIDAETLPRIFDAFFTTKPIGIGTGLGLAICHRIITAAKGRIEVDSQPGEGTVFRVLLPVRRRETREVPMVYAAGLAAPRGRAVLVVEDEPALCRVLERLLVAHKVTSLTRARQALERIHKGDQFDVIVCDVMMPDMTGMEFYDELMKSHSGMATRVVFMSGGGLTPHARAFLDRVPNLLLDKPIDAARLNRSVDEILSKP
jgi:signal transduction histidine kinase